MTDHPHQDDAHDDALQVALAYHRAWTGGDLEGAMSHVAPGITCHAPGGTLRGAQAFGAFMGPFAAMTTASRVLCAFGDDRTALVMYDVETTLVAHAPGAERLDVVDGAIVEVRIVFDRLPFERARHGA